MCSPTRASLLTGRNHHRVGNGQIAELANDWDGYSGDDPEEQRARRRGAASTTATAPRRGASGTTRRPRRPPPPARSTTGRPGSGFEYFYGFLAGEASQYEPNLVRNTTVVLPPKTPGGGLPPERGPGRRRHRLAAQAQGLRARQAVLHVLGQRLPARPAPHHEGVGRQVRRASSTTAGTPTASASSRAPRRRAGSRPTRELTPRDPTMAGLGRHPRGREAVPAPADGGRGRLRRARRRPGRPAGRRDRAARATATTP